MKPVPGLSRFGAQWALVVGAVVLIAVLWWALLELRASRGAQRALTESVERVHRERSALEADLARERATREALALEIARLRSAGGTSAAVPQVPTLTLTPGAPAGGAAPETAITAPAPERTVELRLVLPASAPRLEHASIVARDWSTGGGRWTITGRAAVGEGRRLVRAFVTGEMLAAGSYEILLRGDGDETVAVYGMGIRR
jgi:hypothetical protein